MLPLRPLHRCLTCSVIHRCSVVCRYQGGHGFHGNSLSVSSPLPGHAIAWQVWIHPNLLSIRLNGILTYLNIRIFFIKVSTYFEFFMLHSRTNRASSVLSQYPQYRYYPARLHTTTFSSSPPSLCVAFAPAHCCPWPDLRGTGG